MDFLPESINFLNILDVFIVGYLFFLIYKLLKGTIAFNIVIGVILFYAVYWIVTALDMRLLSLLLGKFVSFGALILLIIFQPEIRRFLLMVGSTTLKGRLRFLDRFLGDKDTVENVDFVTNTKTIADAVEKLAKTKTGALIVLANSDVENLVKTGKSLDAELSSTLLENLFFKNAPLHDGAVIIKGDRIAGASIILPVSENRKIDGDLGLRHRAAIGASENTNLVCIVVSEETGQIAMAINGKISRNIGLLELKERVNQYYQN